MFLSLRLTFRPFRPELIRFTFCELHVIRRPNRFDVDVKLTAVLAVSGKHNLTGIGREVGRILPAGVRREGHLAGSGPEAERSPDVATRWPLKSPAARCWRRISMLCASSVPVLAPVIPTAILRGHLPVQPSHRSCAGSGGSGPCAGSAG